MPEGPASPETAAAALARPPFRLFRPKEPSVALGLAVNYLMMKPAFAKLRFGEWSRVLVGQINRQHYFFAADTDNRVQGFIGWAFTGRDKAERWVEGGRALSYEDSLEGECVVFNAWSANTRHVHYFLVDAARRVVAGKETIYFKRFYDDGTIRPMRLSVNAFVAGHIRRGPLAPSP